MRSCEPIASIEAIRRKIADGYRLDLDRPRDVPVNPKLRAAYRLAHQQIDRLNVAYASESERQALTAFDLIARLLVDTDSRVGTH